MGLDRFVATHRKTIMLACFGMWALNIVLFLAGVRYPTQNGLQFFLLFGGIWLALSQSRPVDPHRSGVRRSYKS